MSHKYTLVRRLRDAADAIEELNRLDAREDWSMWNAAQLRDMSGVLEDEWRDAVRDMSEMDRAATEYDVRRADGMSGDREDAKYAP